jgi:hypothetical protein
MFRSRIEMIAYVIASMTEKPVKDCQQEAFKYENKPFIIRYTLD